MGGEAEVIAHGRDRDPWRPSRRLVGIAIAMAVLLTAGTTVGHEVQQRRAERAAESQAVRLAAFDVEELLPGGEGGWRLSNLTDTRFTMDSAVLDFPHQNLLPRPQALLPRGSLVLRMSPVPCEDGLYDRGPSAMVIGAVTDKGSRLTRRLVLDAGTKQGGWAELRRLCRALDPWDALVGEIATASETANPLQLTYNLRNVGALPLTLEAIRYEPGVSVTMRPLPIVLPAGTGPDPGPMRRLVVELRVTSCRRLEAALRDAEGGHGLDGWGTLKPQLRHAHGQGSGYLDLGGHYLDLGRTCANIERYLDSQGGP